MKKITFLSIFLFFFANSFFSQVTVSLSTSSGAITPDLLSLNGRSTEGPSWDDVTFKSMVADMNPGFVRYPGGTQGNQWDWRTGTLIPQLGTAKYIFTPNQVVAGIPTNTKLIYVVNMAVPTPNTGITFTTTTDSHLSTQATLDAKIKDIIAALDNFNTLGHLPEFVELGNEHYFSNEPAGVYGANPTLHINHAKQIAVAINAKYPSIKFLVCTTKGGTTGRDAWNNAIFNAINSDAVLKPLVHAVVQHHYINETYGYLGLVNDVATAKNIIKEGMQYAVETKADYDLVPASLKLWFTEFGATKLNADGMWAAGLRAANMTLGFMMLGDKIENLTLHHITDNPNVITNLKTKLGPVGVAFKMLNTAIKNNTIYKKIVFSNMNISDPYSTLYGFKFTGNSQGEENIVIINTSETTYSNINLSPAFSKTGVKLSKQYWSNTPYTANISDADLTLYENLDINNYTINPFSITVIKTSTPSVSIHGANNIAEGASFGTLGEAINTLNLAGDQAGKNITLKILENCEEGQPINITQPTINNWNSLKIYPVKANLSITGNISNNALIEFFGADNITIDGRVNATGSTPSLEIANISTSDLTKTSTLRFRNDACNNKIQYCNIKGSTLCPTEGVISFSTTASTTGNDNNLIAYNKISSYTNASRPLNLIYSYANVGKENSENTISNNELFDFFNSGTSSNAILLDLHTTNWNITGNSFYETTTFQPTLAGTVYKVISINNVLSGNNFNITNNYIGGNAKNASGTFTKTASDNEFNAMYINASSCNIQNNKIQNISWTQSDAKAKWVGINLIAGNATIGTTTGNTIGSSLDNNSIYYVCNGKGGAVTAINIASSGNVDCNNNIIGSITTSTFAKSNSASIYGIVKTATSGNLTLRNNQIGSSTTTNSINASYKVTATNQTVYGISIKGSGPTVIESNKIQNLTNATTSGADICGIYYAGTNVTAGSNVVSGNFISNLSLPYTTVASIYGISINSGSTNYTNNVISLSSSATNSIYGVYDNGASSSSNKVYFNTIYIGGTQASGTLRSYALYSVSNLNTRDFSNNILHNDRSGTGAHFALYLAYGDNTNLTCNGNNYFAGGTNGVLGYHTAGTYSNTYHITSLSALKTATAQDNYSQNTNTPFFAKGGVDAYDYQLYKANLCGYPLASVTTDYGQKTRNTTPSIGAFEFDPKAGNETVPATQVTVFPTIFSNVIQCTTPGHSNVKITLSDIMGKQVKTWTAETETTIINTENIANGIYLMQVELGDEYQVFKLIKK